MTEEAKRAVEHLRENAEFQWCSDCYVGDECGGAYHSNCHFLRIADLIESLSAKLERYDKAIVNNAKIIESAYRQRDAAVEDIPRECHKCKHFKVLFNGCTPDYDCDYSDVCIDNDCWQWRGVGGAE